MFWTFPNWVDNFSFTFPSCTPRCPWGSMPVLGLDPWRGRDRNRLQPPWNLPTCWTERRVQILSESISTIMFNLISPAYIWLVPSWSGDSPSFFHSNDLIPLLWACQWLPPPYLGRGRFQTITVVFAPFCEVLRAKTYFYELDFSTLPFLAASGSHSQRAPDTVPAPSLKVHRSPTAWALAPDPSSLKFPLTITILKPLAACARGRSVQCFLIFHFVILLRWRNWRQPESKFRATFDVLSYFDGNYIFEYHVRRNLLLREEHCHGHC